MKEDKEMMNTAGTLQDVIESILKTIDLNRSNREREDLFRTNATASSANGKASILGFLGIDYDFGNYMDGEYLLTGYFRVEDVELVKNGEIDWRAYANAVLDERHGWGTRKLTADEIA